MQPVHPIPRPKVPSPKITAPPEARRRDSIVPPPVSLVGKEPMIEEALEYVPLPELVREPLFKAMTKVNKVIFKSRPPGPPVPEQPGSWTFSALGDYGSGSRAQTDVARNILAKKPDLLVTLGDNVYWSGTEKEYQKKWDPPQYFGDVRTNIPVMPSLGNHDTRKSTKPYFDRFPELGGARYYSFDHKNVHFTALNTTESLAPGSPQLKWLDRDLQATDKPFKVVYFHHPMYSGYPKDNGPLKGYLAPVLAKHGVDLVLSGHEHNYQRTRPLNEHGTIEVTPGGGGHTLYPFVTRQGEVGAYRDVDYGHLDVEVRNDALVGRYVVRDGTVRDTFVLPARKGSTSPSDAKAGAAAVAAAAPAAPVATPA